MFGDNEYVELMEELDQVDVISWKQLLLNLKLEPVYLKERASGVLTCICVFHCEKTPSMWLRPSRLFQCYGCGGGGTQVTFIRRLLNLSADVSVLDLASYFRNTEPSECQLCAWCEAVGMYNCGTHQAAAGW